MITSIHILTLGLQNQLEVLFSSLDRSITKINAIPVQAHTQKKRTMLKVLIVPHFDNRARILVKALTKSKLFYYRPKFAPRQFLTKKKITFLKNAFKRLKDDVKRTWILMW